MGEGIMDQYEAKRMAREIMREHGLHDWALRISSAKKAQGSCSYTKREIALSGVFIRLNDAPRVRLTILHEVAHALVGRQAGHGPIWRNKCIEIGGDGKQYATNLNVLAWVGRCTRPECGGKVCGHFSRRPTKTYVHATCQSMVKWTQEVVAN